MNFQNSIELTAISQPQIQLQLKQKQKDVIVTRCPQLSIGASGIFYHQKNSFDLKSEKPCSKSIAPTTPWTKKSVFQRSTVPLRLMLKYWLIFIRYVISLERTQFPLRERGSDQIYFDFKELHDLPRKYIFHIFLHKILKEGNILFLR